MQQLLILSETLKQSIRLQIIGDTDGRGGKILNQQLAQQRAEWMLNWLRSAGIDSDILIVIPPAKIRFGENEPDPNHRRVIFRVIILD